MALALLMECNIDDGISITYGMQHNHIWSYMLPKVMRCGMIHLIVVHVLVSRLGFHPQQFITENYYCESGNPTDSADDNEFFSNDPLWDGQQCEGTCCNGTNSPPWFSVQLPTPTTDMIEVSICLNQNTADEDTPIELLEIYVQ